MAKPDLLKLPIHFEIESGLQEQLSSRPGHQRCMEGTVELLLVLHEVPQLGRVEGEAWFFWKRSDGRWTQPGGPGINELSELLLRYETTIQGHQQALQQTASAAQAFAILRNAGPLESSTRNLASALEQALNFEPDDRDIRNLRDRSKSLERAADLLLADARITLDYFAATHQENQAQALERLSNDFFRLLLLIGILLITVLFYGTFGMSLKFPSAIVPIFFGTLIGGLIVGGFLRGACGRQTKELREIFPMRQRLVGLREFASGVRNKRKQE